MTRPEDRLFEDLAQDMMDRTLVEREGRAVIVAAPSGAGKTTLIGRAGRKNPDLSVLPGHDGGPPGMLFVQVPPACTLADLGVEIARAAGYPVRDGVKANVAWGAAMRRIKDKGIRFMWIDEFQNVTELANIREARKIRNTVKMALINIRHTMGLVISGDQSITEFLRSDKHILRRSDVMGIAPVKPKMFEGIAEAITRMAKKAGLRVARGLKVNIVPRLVHASLGQFGTALEIARVTILRACSSGTVEPNLLTIDHFARSWALSNKVAAHENPFVSPRWAELDCAAIAAHRRTDVVQPPEARRGRKARQK